MFGEDVKMASTNRLDSVDVFRAFGIIIMIMGHVGFGKEFNQFIHSFHMPMFFIISGYFYKSQPFCKMAKKKAKTLLLPYLTIGILHIIIYFIAIGQIDTHAFYLFLWENTADNGIPIAGALWFLTAMFFSEMFFWCIQQLRISDLRKNVAAGAVAILGMTCATFLPLRLPLALDVSMVGVGFYQTGKVIKEKYRNILETNAILSILGITFFSILSFVNSYVNLRKGNYGTWPLFWINAIGMTVAFWNFFCHAYGWAKNKHFLEKPMAWLKVMGRDSIIFLCLNQLAIFFTGDLVRQLVTSNNMVDFFIEQLLILLISVIELLIARKVIMGTKLRIIFGK